MLRDGEGREEGALCAAQLALGPGAAPSCMGRQLLMPMRPPARGLVQQPLRSSSFPLTILRFGTACRAKIGGTSFRAAPAACANPPCLPITLFLLLLHSPASALLASLRAAEIDRTLKKVDEGIQEFDAKLEEVQGASTQLLKEKHEEELKKGEWPVAVAGGVWTMGMN